MPRQKRADEGGLIYHALNRGNARQTIFRKAEDYEAFLRVLAEGLQRYPVELFSFTLLPNHWHMVLRPSEDGLMGRMLRWVTATHTQRYHAHYHTSGEGHLYQARFKSFRLLMTITFWLSAGTSSEIRYEQTWSSGRKIGVSVRCGDGHRGQTGIQPSCRRGQFLARRTGSNV